MSLKIHAFRDPYLNTFSLNEKDESSSQIENTKTSTRKTLQNRVLANVHDYMTAKTIFNIKCSKEIMEFVNTLISRLKSKKLFHQLKKITKIKTELKELEDNDLGIIRLSIVNGKNPIIRKLKSLDDKAIDALKDIPLPKFFSNFFEELEFNARVDRIYHQKDPVESIEQLISFSKSLTERKDWSGALHTLSIAQKAANKKIIRFDERINFFREIASSFFQIGDRQKTVATLKDGIACVGNDSPTHKQQIRYFQEISLDLIHFNAWDVLIKFIDVFTNSSHLDLEERTQAFDQVFKKIFELHGLDKGLSIVYRLRDCLEKDLLIEKLADIASNKPDWMDDAVQMVKRIQNLKIRARASEMVSQKIATEDSKEIEPQN